MLRWSVAVKLLDKNLAYQSKGDELYGKINGVVSPNYDDNRRFCFNWLGLWTFCYLDTFNGLSYDLWNYFRIVLSLVYAFRKSLPLDVVL